MNLYKDNDKYFIEFYKDKDEWRINRSKGIGGSDASALVEMNPYKTLIDLWKDKEYGSPEITNPAIEYGNTCENLIRELYKAKHLTQEVQYIPDAILTSKRISWMRYSPDGLIYDPILGKGILEIKTMHLQNMKMLAQWDNGVPNHYYIQTLHGLLVTEFDFVVFCAELRWKKESEVDGFEQWESKIIERVYTRQEALEDLKILENKEKENWKYFENHEMPPLSFQL